MLDLTPIHLVTVTVTYHPDLDILNRQLASLPQSAVKIVVDNGSGEHSQAKLRDMLAQLQHAWFLPQSHNLGLPAAINLGVRMAATLSGSAPTHVLLLDQDSEPQPGSIQRLCAALTALEQAGQRPGAVGPRLVDDSTGLDHGFHGMTRWRWRRLYPRPGDRPVSIANLNGSGTLMRLEVFEQLGGLDASLFIDHVDTEWSFRLLAAGYSLWGVPDAVFLHRMGERGLRFWLMGWRVWPARSALRHQYLFRNALWLMHRPYVPATWKYWAAIKLLLTAFVHGLFDPQRSAQLAAMIRGVRLGLRDPSKCCE